MERVARERVIVLAVVRDGYERIESFVDQVRADFAEVATFAFVARTILESSNPCVVGHWGSFKRIITALHLRSECSGQDLSPDEVSDVASHVSLPSEVWPVPSF